MGRRCEHEGRRLAGAPERITCQQQRREAQSSVAHIAAQLSTISRLQAEKPWGDWIRMRFFFPAPPLKTGLSSKSLARSGC
jgi:hypothetical protein